MEVATWPLQTLLEVADRMAGEKVVDSVFLDWGLDVRHIVQDEDWVSLSFVETLAQRLRTVCGPNLMREAGWLSMSPRSLGMLYPLFRMFGSPWSALEHIVRAAPRYNKHRELSLERLGSTQARVTMRLIPGTTSRGNRDFCEFARYQMKAVPSFFGCPTDVVHDQCIADGHDACIYDITWQEPASRAALPVLATLGGAGLASICAWALGITLPLALLPMSLGGIAGLLLVLYLREASARTEQLRALDDHSGALNQSLADAERRYAELAEAKTRVEERVRDRTAALSKRSEQLGHALEELRAADEAKSNFLNHISHELRTPLTLILGPLRAMQSDQLSADEVRRHADTMSRNAEQLLRMINELLDLARSESGHESLSRQAVSVDALAQESLEAMEPNARLQGLEIRTELASAAPLSLDAHWLKSAVDNLLSNALAHARTKVRLRTEVQGSELHIEVSDDGEGIASELQASIFDRYVRAPHTKRVGSGLGLAIVREAARLHGGDVSVESEPGKGATFRISVPAKPAESTEQSAPRNTPPTRPPEASSERPAPYPNAPHLLVVEDHEDLRAFIADILAPRYAVHGAHNGLEGLKLARKLHPDVIITDVAMDGMDGLELTRELRQDPTTRDIPILVVTARGEPEAAVRGFEAGADDYIPKPFHAAELLARVDAQLRLRQAQARIAHAHRVEATRDIAIALLNQLLDPLSVVLQILPQLGQAPGGQALALAQSAGERLGQVVDNIQQLAAPSRGQHLRPGSTLAALAEIYSARSPETHIELDIRDDSPINADPAQINHALLHVLDSLLSLVRSTAQITLRTELVDSDVVLSVIVSPAVDAVTLRSLATTRDLASGASVSGPQWRVAMAREAIEALGGAMDVRSAQNRTLVQMTLPVSPVAVDRGEQDCTDRESSAAGSVHQAPGQ